MGLDWNPGPKAKPSYDREFTDIWGDLHHEPCLLRERKVSRFKEITVTALETLGAPRVGFDPAATAWVLQRIFPNRKDKALTEEDLIVRMTGFYVLELVPPCDGIPRYSNGQTGGYVEQYSFRGEFLKHCVEIIGEELLKSAYISKLPKDTVAYGDKLMEAGSRFAFEKGIDTAKIHLPQEPDSCEFRLDVVFSAGRWCRFWGQKGHWLEAYF